MKSKKTLYSLILKEFRKNDSFICSSIGSLLREEKITNNEYIIIHKDFNDNKPSDVLHSEFITDSWVGSYAWWNSDAKKVRIAFLKKMIAINS